MKSLSIATLSASLVLFSLGTTVSKSQAPAASQQPAKQKVSCSTTKEEPPTEAQKALRDRNYTGAEQIARDEAEKNLNNQPVFAKAIETQTRALIAQRKTMDAIKVARAALAHYKDDPVLLDALGEAYMRRGEMDKVAIVLVAAMKADPCNARTHYDFARYSHLDTQYLTESRQLEAAHALAPDNKTYARMVKATEHVTTPEQRLQRLQERIDDTSLTAQERNDARRALALLQASSRGSCELAHPTESATIPLVPIANGPTDMYAAGLQLQINGKSRRLELDTGASGLLISSSVAKAAGLISEAQSSSFGVGDAGNRTVDVAHVDTIKIGSLEFHNCLVRIFDKHNGLDVDGLIGADVFSSWIVTIDTPQRQLRLSPLPKLPDESAAKTTLDTSGSASDASSTRRNRYIPPGMENWTPVFRSGHDLLFPTNINNGPTRLFLMDTGASNEGLISIDAAREVTSVDSSERQVHGISGEVNDVRVADTVTLTFAKVREQLHDVNAIDMSRLGTNTNIEVSGLIGFYTLRELVISIDYRDSLVHVVYDPKTGFHRH